MSKPVIFTISAVWDDEASVWSGHCDDIPAAADAPTLDELLAKISAMALDLLARQSSRRRSGVAVSSDHGAARSRARRSLNGSAIRQAVRSKKDVDGRVKPGHDGEREGLARKQKRPGLSTRPFKTLQSLEPDCEPKLSARLRDRRGLADLLLDRALQIQRARRERCRPWPSAGTRRGRHCGRRS